MNVSLSYKNMFEVRGSTGYKKRWSFLVPQPYFDLPTQKFNIAKNKSWVINYIH
jgi:hypothetical protein